MRALLPGLIGLIALTAAAAAADVGASRRSARVVEDGCRLERICRAGRCATRQVCPPLCPDRYSCRSLYGAYGPWGGRQYWSSFSPAYW